MRMPGGNGGSMNVPREAEGSADFPRVYSNPQPTVDRARGNTNDDQIIKNKTPWMHRGYAIPAGTGGADFDQNSSGPSRVEMHLRTFTYRKEAGAYNSDTTGMHTVVPKLRTNHGTRKPSIMTSGRQSRLTTSLLRGQSFSETTVQQGTGDKK
jgi:hypothetical protein